jgi:carboxyl-terminal processing protease
MLCIRKFVTWGGVPLAYLLGAGLVLAGEPAVSNPAAEAASESTAAPGPEEPSALEDLIAYTEQLNVGLPMLPGPYYDDIVRLTLNILENAHYSRKPFRGEVPGHFLKLYFDLLDPLHFHFTAEDHKDFEVYRARLVDLTRKEGSTAPAFEIFARFLTRVDQRVRQATQDLARGNFDFEGDEHYLTSREDAPPPENLEAARALWRKHLRYEYLNEKLNGSSPEEIVETLAKRYKRTLRLLAEFESDDILQIYLSALTNAYDPHTDYMGKAQLENFAIGMKLSLFGIGALLSYQDGYCTIESLVAEGPAERSGKLQPKDRIVEVQQEGEEPVDVVDMKLQKVVELIRGPKDTEVTLTIIPADSTDSSVRRRLTLVRDEIKLRDQQARAEIIDLPDAEGVTNRIGLIDLPSFYATIDLGEEKDGESEPRSTTADVEALIKKLEAEGVTGIVLDLRRNGGGSLEEAIRLTGLFIDEGPIVQVRDTLGDINIESDPNPGVLYDGPLVVLTSRFSASASEILAAALQDYGRALIVGDSRTHGKGTVQTIFELARSGRFPRSVNPGAVKITIRKYYRANGESTQLRGMVPDIVLPSVNNLLEVGEASLDYPLRWDHIPSADFQTLNRIRPHLEDLVRRTEARQGSDPDFAYVREDMAEYERRQAEKSVSLNEAERRQEKQEAEDRKEARAKERESRKSLGEIRYEITLARAGEPGLPPPVGEDPEASEAASAANGSFHIEGSPPAAVVAPDKTADAAEEEDADAEAPPVVDVTLKETKRILLDLMHLASPDKGHRRSPPVAVTAK